MTITALFVCREMDKKFCMGVPVIRQEKLKAYQEGLDIDLEQITFCGAQAPADTPSSSLYISQPLASLNRFFDLKGTIGNTNRNQYMYFLEDEALANPGKAMREGAPLTLIVAEDGYYCRLRVVLTSLPVVRLHGEKDENGQFDEREWGVKRGQATVFSNEDESERNVSVKTSALEWDVRGASSKGYPKKSWKLAFKNEQNENKNMGFLGMGEEDDWILNSLYMDDTKIKEKLMMDIWNQYIGTDGRAYQMSTGEYVELVLNGKYHGVYLMQRRVDEKYLQLNREKDILFKGNITWDAATLEEGYEIIHSSREAEETYAVLEEVLNGAKWNAQEFIDTDLYLSFCNATDNMAYKNMFHVLRFDGQGYEMQWLPWDTDMALGVIWTVDFSHEYDASMDQIVHRREYETIREHMPAFDAQYRNRWKELRETAFSPEKIEAQIKALHEQLEGSGAFQREQDRWNVRYAGKDTYETMIRWCKERAAKFDQLYSVSSCNERTDAE